MKSILRLGSFKGFNVEIQDIEIETEMTPEELERQIGVITSLLENLPKYNFGDPNFA